jgi:flagellar biosynthesis protein FliQ
MQPARQSPWMTALEIALAVILPIAGLVIAIVLFATKRIREASYVFVATIIGAGIALALYV